MKDAIFIGSSSKGKELARAIKAQLSEAAEVTVWDEGLFLLGTTTLTSILTFRYRFDFAILVLTPDDIVVFKGGETKSPRDNVLFELGVFLSFLSPDKTFVVTSQPDVRLPSDLAGLTVAQLEENRSDQNVDAMVSTACHKIRTAMRSVQAQSRVGLLPSTALALGYFNNFVENVCSAFTDENATMKIKGRKVKHGDETVQEPDTDLSFLGKNLKLVIVIPDDIAKVRSEQDHGRDVTPLQRAFVDFSHGTVANLQKMLGRMRQVELKTKTRLFPFYTFIGRQEIDQLEFFDIPTTLNTSLETVSFVLGTVIGDDNMQKLIMRREIRNFRLTIERLAKQRAAGQFVEVADLSYLESLADRL
jgi:hypothetical protein